MYIVHPARRHCIGLKQAKPHLESYLQPVKVSSTVTAWYRNTLTLPNQLTSTASNELAGINTTSTAAQTITMPNLMQ